MALSKIKLDSAIEIKLQKLFEKPKALSTITPLIKAFFIENNLNKGQQEIVNFYLRESDFLTPLRLSWSKPNFKKDIVTSVKNPNKFLLARALYPSSYVTYEAAIYCLKLNEVEPKNIHMAKERLNYSSNKESNLITNDLLANAFLKEPRKSSHYASYNGTIFTFIEREFTNLIGIEPSIRFGEEVLTTNIERTLIDVAISPQYVGGYKKACKIWNQFFLQNEINIQELATMYQKLNYKYPYWQRIGFILKNEANEKLANDWKQFFSKPQFSFFADRPFAKNWSYDNEWHIYYPN